MIPNKSTYSPLCKKPTLVSTPPPTPYSLLPTPYSLLPTPYSLFPLLF
ncbi:MAG: hypothetical protein F6K53_40505 [Moorea sp. SIO4A1]|nr:hypothetical protein [Moorena sp. SIO4A1]NEQ63288.1 hypothetical protein [Moorena sp. SIO4A1]